MSTQVYESALIPAPIDKVWALVRPLDFKFLDTVKSTELGKSASGDGAEVGSLRTVKYKDGTSQTLKLTELSDARHLVSYELLESTPAVSVLSAVHTVRLRRITDPERPPSCLVESISDFSSDATALVLADAKLKKVDFFKALSKAATAKKRKNWMPLESNPKLMNRYLKALGVNLSGLLEFQDVLGLEPDVMSWIQSPQMAILLTFPINKAAEEHRKAEEQQITEAMAKAGTPATAATDAKAATTATAAAAPAAATASASTASTYTPVSPNVYHMKQTVGNACGTVALIHAVANNRSNLPLEKGKFFDNFLKATAKMDSVARAQALEENTEIEVTHQQTAHDPDAKSQAASAFNDDLHFNCFVCVDNGLYELDGRKKFPIAHGPTTPQTLLKDSAKVIKQFMARASGDGRFAIIALAPPSPFSD